jgi:hypothetical protein
LSVARLATRCTDEARGLRLQPSVNRPRCVTIRKAEFALCRVMAFLSPRSRADQQIIANNYFVSLRVDGQILKKEKAGLARHDDIEVPVAIDIDHWNL